jgi:alkanesulfonate monooxygenase SsuD/methylene tetrahydromethanopterin reductase-like flavin-dependent oxidoreductase (luciferase family)
MAAQATSRIRFGPLVTPVTFRSPVDVGRMAAQVDRLSGGRFVMGLGAGWNEAEHRAYGIPFPAVKERMDRLEEAIHVMRALWGDGPAGFEGAHYRLENVDCQPKPARAGGPPILIGGAGEKRTLKIVAKYAAEWNSVNLPPDAYRGKVDTLQRHCEAQNRDPATIRRSMMMFHITGPSEAHLEKITERVMRALGAPAGATTAEYRAGAKARGMLVGGVDEIVDRLGRLGDLGLQEVEFQHFDFDSDDIPEFLASDVVPQVKAL